jgi:dienelactone hydrolase
VAAVSATAAIARYQGPVLLAHGDDDAIVPAEHLDRLAAAARAGRAADPDPAPVETQVVAGGQHSWLYEDEGYRRTMAAFLARSLGGPFDPVEAADLAAAAPARRLPEAEARFEAVEETAGGFRTLAQVALPGATRRRPDPVAADATDGAHTSDRSAATLDEPA